MQHKELNVKRIETVIDRWLPRLLVVIAVAAGWFIPEFYDWTGADQSRPAPIIGWVALCIVGVDVLLFVLLAWLQLSRNVPSAETTKRWRFSLLHILFIMTGAAVFLMFARLLSLQIASYLLQGIVVAIGIWMAIQFPWTRWRIGWIAVLQIAPFLWVLRQLAVSNYGPSLLVLLTSFPALLPTALFVQPNHESTQWLLTFLTTTEFAIGLWLSYLGPKRTLAYGIVVVTLSIFSSFVFNAAMRM